ncbi:unnamed protein product [Dicrocoelium dendriticum]|nr:unnamed protein product [Dicrocoelium dendriticum]
MDPRIFDDVADTLAKLRMYPYFDVCHYILMSTAVKEDTPQSGSPHFSRRHPFSCWLATMLMCFGGTILSSFICGSPLFLCFDNFRDVFTATAVWYLLNYFPFDVLYRTCKFLPIRVFICSLKEVQRARKISLGVRHGLHHFPDSAVTCVLLGLLKGCGSVFMQPVSRVLMGFWAPIKSPFLAVNFTTKISMLASVAYYCHRLDVIPLSENQLFLAVAAIFVYLRVTMILLGLKDPFTPFENIVCTVLFGGTVDALRSAFERSRAARAASANAASSPPPIGPSSGVTYASSTLHGPGVTAPSSASSPVAAPSTATLANGQTSVKDSAPRQPTDKKRD